MVGLNPAIISSLNKEKAIGRVLTDIQSDFIFAPQYKLIFDYVPDELWDQLIGQLKAGTFRPDSLITSEVPKSSGMTRPGSILYPADRLLYQAISDCLAHTVDNQLDDSRVFSYRLLDSDPSFQMFQSRGDSYQEFKTAITSNAECGQFTHAATIDITSYFVHLNHHVLENLLTESQVPQPLITVLVKHLLENWSGRFSYGIPQGLYPSDLLGNFYLSTLDTYLASRGIQSLRYVDDLVLFYRAERDARVSLAPICQFLRTIGLDLNESKSKIVTVQELIHEHTELDTLFENARQEVIEIFDEVDFFPSYGFLDPWEEFADEEGYELEPAIELLAIEKLWDSRVQVTGAKRDQMDNFCLGALGHIASDLAVDIVLSELGNRPHLTRSYCKYISKFIHGDNQVQKRLCNFIERDQCVYDWELQWPIAALLSAETIPTSTVNKALGILTDPQRSNELRAACALLIGKFGGAPSRSNLRSHWGSENSDHVRSAMILSTMFFGKEERQVLLGYWGNQKPLYGLVASGVRKQSSGSAI